MEASSVVQIGRDAVLDDFLQDDTQKLFWIDSDMVWEPGDFLRLLALSTTRGVVCAAYPRKVDGPIQFDAAIDPTVGKKKMPDSEVAGRATVLIFPDLNTGNNTYKAVQRSSGALAVGPVLQGLNKPVNDLSRGALVDDIVNTIAITAIQAQHS